MSDHYARQYVNQPDQWDDKLVDLAQKLATLNQQSFTDFLGDLSTRSHQIRDKLQTKALVSNGLAALAISGAIGGVIAGAPIAMIATATAGSAAFAGNMLYNLAKKNFGNSDKAALMEMSKEAAAREPHDSMSAKASQFLTQMWNKVRKYPSIAHKAIETAIAKQNAKPSLLTSPLAERNQAELEAKPQPAVPMTFTGLHTMRQAIARQLHGLADTVKPDGPPRPIADIAGEAIEKAKASGSAIAHKAVDAGIVAANKVYQTSNALGSKLVQTGDAAKANVTGNIALVKSLMVRVDHAYQVLMGDMEVKSNPAAKVTQTLQNANIVAGLTVGPAAQQVQEARQRQQGPGPAPTMNGA